MDSVNKEVPGEGAITDNITGDITDRHTNPSMLYGLCEQ